MLSNAGYFFNFLGFPSTDSLADSNEDFPEIVGNRKYKLKNIKKMFELNF